MGSIGSSCKRDVTFLQTWSICKLIASFKIPPRSSSTVGQFRIRKKRSWAHTKERVQRGDQQNQPLKSHLAQAGVCHWNRSKAAFHHGLVPQNWRMSMQFFEIQFKQCFWNLLPFWVQTVLMTLKLMGQYLDNNVAFRHVIMLVSLQSRLWCRCFLVPMVQLMLQRGCSLVRRAVRCWMATTKKLGHQLKWSEIETDHDDG